jgi:hypothetical protein
VSRSIAFAVVLVAACGGDGGVPVGGECSREEPCEDGAVCDFTAPDGINICLDGAGDEDGDGLPNAQDFCSHQPGGRFDEDLDGIGDDCDRCPIAFPASNPDTDGDDVDSPCDPDPNEPGDVIVVFDGFNDGALPTGWMATAGWEFVGGEAIVTPLDVVNNEVLVAPLPLVSNHIAVIGQYRIDELDPQATSRRAGIVAVDQRPAGGSDITCAGVRGGDNVDALTLDTTVSASSDMFLTSLFDTGGLYRATLKVDNATAGCALVADTETGAATTNTIGEASNQGGLTVRGVTARFQFLLVTQRGPVNPD